MDDLPNRLADLRSRATNTVLDFLRTVLDTASIFADVVETEHQIGDFDAAHSLLTRAEDGIGTVLRFLSNPKHGLAEYDRQALMGQIDHLRERLDGLKADPKLPRQQE